jgi:hypothetical protein
VTAIDQQFSTEPIAIVLLFFAADSREQEEAGCGRLLIE